MSTIETIREPAKDIPVFRRCDVLVIGGGPAGSAPGNPMGLSLHDQEAETFIKLKKEYTKAS